MEDDSRDRRLAVFGNSNGTIEPAMQIAKPSPFPVLEPGRHAINPWKWRLVLLTFCIGAHVGRRDQPYMVATLFEQSPQMMRSDAGLETD